MTQKSTPRVIGFAGWSGAGKTTLIAKLIPVLRARGMSVSTLKHAHHGFDVDTPGKDSHTHREAGAYEVLVASAKRFALMHEFRDEPEMSLAGLLAKFAPVDIILIEGFKTNIHPKIEVYREANNKPLIALDDPYIIAIAAQGAINCAIPVLDIDDIDTIADLVIKQAMPLNILLDQLT